MRQYPQLEFDLALLRSNADAVISRCRGMGIRVCGVIKGVDGLPEAARVLRAAGAAELGTSRLEQVAKCRAAGVPGPWLLIRIPGLTELPDVVALCETSLQSEWPTLLALEEECLRQNKTHRVIVMTDLGDLREGFWDKDELVDVCERVERELPHVQLAGIGVNLTCYGSTKPTPEKMNELVGLARQVEQRIGRKLEIVSGGATSSFTLVHWGTMPAGVNHLRIGEAILLGKDLQVDWGIRDMDYLRMDALTLRAEVVEVKDKPTYPIGEFAIDAFGRKPVYEDRGIRRRAILALGRADVGELESLIPREPGLTVIGGSSDHCIVDVEDCPRRLQVGDIVEFSLCYSHMLYATARSDMRIIFKNQSAQEE
ncbi:MAG: alanine racemase [Vescimonas sp.]|uniref:alanine racemase n=1 Tax=Vescimonas sp. TaxID=2892404 RepID=UPI002A90E9A4|nr:alanine racemase [Vescimonas sp.]MDY5333803.1 alanine racemase [Vescimonas sp.]